MIVLVVRNVLELRVGKGRRKSTHFFISGTASPVKQLPHGFRLICELLLRKCISCHTSLFVCVIHFNEEFCTSGSSYHFMYTALKLFAAVFSVFAISKYISKEDYECL